MKICTTSLLLKNILLHEKKPDIGNGVEHSTQKNLPSMFDVKALNPVFSFDPSSHLPKAHRNFLDGTFPSIVQPVERSLKRQRRSVSFPNVTQRSQSVTLFVTFLRRAYAILPIRTSVIVCSFLEPGDEEQEPT